MQRLCTNSCRIRRWSPAAGGPETGPRAHVRPAAGALRAQGPDAAQPRGEHVARAGVRRGRDAQGPLPALPPREGPRRGRADHDRRLRGDRAGQPAVVRQPAALPGRDRAVAAPAGRRRARGRRGRDVPGDPPGPPDQQLHRRLAAAGLPLAAARAGAPQLPEGGRGLGPGADPRRLRGGGPALRGGRPRRHRGAVVRPLLRRLHLARDQPPRRRARREPRGTPHLPAAGAPRDPGGRRAGLRGRHPDVDGRARPRGADPRGRPRGDATLHRRRRRLPQRHPGHDRERRPPGGGDPVDGDAVGAAPRLRRRDPPGAGHPGDARVADLRRRHRAARRTRGAGGPGRHDPRPDRRPAPGRQVRLRRRGPDPALRGRQLLPRRDLPVRRRQVHPQPRDRAGADAGPRHRSRAHGAGRRSSSGPARPGWRRRGCSASAATTWSWSRRPTCPAARSGWRPRRPGGAT